MLYLQVAEAVQIRLKEVSKILSAKDDSRVALWVGLVGTDCQTPKQLPTIEIT
jgi:hypothetical protein